MNAISPIAQFSPAAAIEAANTNDAPAVLFAGDAVIDRDALAYALAVAKHATERRHTIPILSNALLLADAGGLAVITTDLDMEIRVDLPAAVDDGFGLTIPTDMLEKLVKKAPTSNFVAVHSAGEKRGHKNEWESVDVAMLDFERAKYRTPALPVGDFPRLAQKTYSHAFTMTGAGFRDLLAAVKGAVSTEETRYYLNGVYLHAHGDLLRAVATDGHRLYRQDVALPAGALDMPGVILPRKLIDIVGKLFRAKATPETVWIGVCETGVRLRFDHVTITSKVIDGSFPDYQRVIPTGNDLVAGFDVAAMQEALSAVTVLQSERGRAVKLAITPGRMLLSVSNPESGTAEAPIACSLQKPGTGSPEIEIGFNAGYVAGILSEIAQGEATAAFADSGAPAVITSPGKDGWLAVLMPMRV